MPIHVRASGVDAAKRSATGVASDQPRATRRPAIWARVLTPISTTSVVPFGASESMAGA